MNPVIDAIKSRRSTKNMKNDVPSHDLIERILEAATWAPNHHLTEPWRFVVIANDERLKLGESMAQALEKTLKKDDPRNEEILKAERQKPFRAPVIIAVVLSPNYENEKVVELEETVAAGAALQNLLLAAHSLGIATMVRTGKHSFGEPVRSYLKMSENEKLVGLVYTGYSAEPSLPSKRNPLESKVEWRGL
ncbi:MAG: nitroreductase [Thaumarchaeota archaeon]|nr:nitroreductase [Nitrososphaerota archaeon]